MRLILHEDDFQGWSASYLYPPNLSQEPWDYGLSDGGSPGEEASVCCHEHSLLLSHIYDAICVVFAL